MEEGVVVDGVLARIDAVVRRDVVGETFLVPIRGSIADLQELFIVNEVGGWIWDRLDRPRHFAEIVAEVAAEFEVDKAQAEADVRLFVQQLAEAGLLTIADEKA
jgi:hypothetical protein